VAGVDAPAGRREAQLQELREHEPGAPATGQPRELVLDAPAHVGVLGAHGAAARWSAGRGADTSAAAYTEEGREDWRRGGEGGTENKKGRSAGTCRATAIKGSLGAMLGSSNVPAAVLHCLQTFELYGESLCLIRPAVGLSSRKPFELSESQFETTRAAATQQIYVLLRVCTLSDSQA